MEKMQSMGEGNIINWQMLAEIRVRTLPESNVERLDFCSIFPFKKKEVRAWFIWVIEGPAYWQKLTKFVWGQLLPDWFCKFSKGDLLSFWGMTCHNSCSKKMKWVFELDICLWRVDQCHIVAKVKWCLWQVIRLVVWGLSNVRCQNTFEEMNYRWIAGHTPT